MPKTSSALPVLLPAFAALIIGAAIGAHFSAKREAEPAPATAAEAPAFDAYAFTRRIDAQPKPETMPKQQQQTVQTVLRLAEAFTRGSLSDIDSIKGPLAAAGFKVTHTENSRPEGGVFREISGELADGSNVALQFIVDNFAPSGFEKTLKISGFNKAQCLALLDQFSLNPKLSLRASRYRDGGYPSSSCAEAGDGRSVTLEARYDGSTVGKAYPENISGALHSMFKGDFEAAGGRVYFATADSHPPFRAYGPYLNKDADIDFVYDAKKSAALIGMANKETCKKILYNLSADIAYAVNGKKAGPCGELNSIEFSPAPKS